MTRRLSTKLTVGLASIVLAVGAAEALARALDPPPTVVVPLRREILYGAPDPLLGWVPRPNLDTFHVTEVDLQGNPVMDYTVSTNSRGFRGRSEYAVPKPADVRRVVVVGDSFTWGQAVHEDETLPAVLAQRAGVEAPNLGVISYGPGQMLLRLQRDGLPLQPDVVLCCLIDDDVHRETERWSINGLARPILMQIGDSDRLFPEPQHSAGLPTTRLPGGTVLPASHGLRRVYEDSLFRLGVGPRWGLFRATIATMARVTQAAGARFAVAVLMDTHVTPLLEILRDVGRRYSFDVIDASAGWWPDNHIADGHPTAHGYQMLADTLLTQAPWMAAR